MTKTIQWLRCFFQPISAKISTHEKMLSALLAFIAVLFTGYISLWFTGNEINSAALPYLAASTGATAILVFVTPHNPLAQPWPVIAGQMFSAFVGVSISVSQLIPDLIIATSVALCLSILVMYFLRCLHPPGGATAIAIVLGGQQIQDMGYWFVFLPIGLNAVLIVLLGVLLTRFIKSRHYPALVKEKTSLSSAAGEWALGAPNFKDEDLREALNNMDSYLTISESDLSSIYATAMLNANKRRLGDVYCKDIMIKSPITFQFYDDLEDAWDTLQKHNIKGAPVVDKYNHLIGIVTTTDYMRHATGHDVGDTMQEKFRNFIKHSTSLTSTKSEVVGQIMSTDLNTAFVDQHIVDLIPVFTEKRFHHMPVVDEKNKVVGVVARSAVMRSMLINRI